MKRFLSIFIIILICFLYSNKNVQAQTSYVEPVDQVISTEIIPSSPKSFQDVSIEITSYSYDLLRSKIDWYINGALKTSGVGKKIFNFTVGDIGSVSKIRYQIQTPEGVVFEKSITISPGDVTLLWESSGYTPPFYKGKSLFSFEGNVRLIAIPNLMNANGVKYKPSELVYTWKRGLGTDTDASGYGKNIFFWNGSIVSNNEEIEVEVSDVNKTVQASASVIIDPREAEILAYADDPALGILFNKTIKNTFNLVGTEVSFVAIPFYFNNPDSDGEYSWFVNGQKSPESSRYITFRNAEGSEGYSKISFDLTSQKKILQSANSSFDIYFGAQKTSTVENIFKNFFGN